jgi:4-hydroxyphenylacetate 3-monooxygenase
MRSGSAYVAALRDGRAVYLDGERVKDVTVHPAFAEPIKWIARTYGRARAAATDPALTFAEPGTGRRHSNMWLVPRSAEDLGARRHVHRFWASSTKCVSRNRGRVATSTWWASRFVERSVASPSSLGFRTRSPSGGTTSRRSGPTVSRTGSWGSKCG